MKCPKCGALMKDDQLYCEHCGEEIRIVPEFEPEIENSIRATLSDVATEITSRPQQVQDSSEKKKRKLSKNKKRTGKEAAFRKKNIPILGGCILIVGLVAFGGVLLMLRYFSPNTQYRWAQKAMEKAQYESAAGYLERARQLSPANVAILNGLSECYYKMGKLEEAAQICLDTISLEGSNGEAYSRLVSIYEQQGRYDSIHELVTECRDDEIRNRYLNYMANPPDVDVKGGTYQEAVSVRLIGNPTGTIYYTLDGSEPDEESPVYISPIPLEVGPYTLRAFFVNQYGVKSEVVREDYYIDVVLPEAPSVLPKTGVYARPHLLEIEVQEDYQVFYTTDGSDPDQKATRYEGNLWMPVGHSVLRFVTVSPSGICSEITERQYTLDLHPLLSMEAASNQLLLMLKNAGVLLNLQGEIAGQAGRYLYTYKYTLTINDHNYYLYREYYEESAGTSSATGKEYVVNYMSGECYQAVQQEDQTFKLYHIEPDETEETDEDENHF